MHLNSVIYEFNISRKNVEYIVKDLDMTQNYGPVAIDIVDNLLSLIETKEKTYAKVVIQSKHGLMLRLSKNLSAQMLTHSAQGLHAFIHPSSEGYLELEDFKGQIESCFNRHGIPYKRYD